ncbi:hypothetical protein LQG66_30175 [Bradyrhizobium ontarionense]|uniref:Uncharacterized protein n=1 Tax=Bradyrhizobium ontarionense TaxID=2898149 RepID=A0ABY3R927_9BRAD|nr:hypothetical protein [Bradyrhizobium sp. A19]UFZ03449.1 hypothetical protein LQG66_30175 [Bradyrhizobium sp. A19]
MRWRAETIVLAAVVLSSSAWLALADLDDFKLETIEIVDVKDRPDKDWLSVKPFSMPMMMATFSADVDLREYARPYGFNISYRVGLCVDGAFSIDATRKLQQDPYVYDSFGNINSYREIRSSPRGASGYHYHVYFDFAFEKAGAIDHPERVPSFLYDLRKTPEDICIRIVGGNMLGQAFQSNNLVIPAAEIAEAFARGEHAKKTAKAGKR